MPAVPRALPFGFGSPRSAPHTRHVAPSIRYNVGAAVTAITGANATNLFTKAAHGFSGGENVVITARTGGAGLEKVEGGGLFVLFVSASTFRLALSPGSPEVDFTTDVTAMTLQKVSSSAPVHEVPPQELTRVNAPRHVSH
jgi:hypothetical protein